MLSYLLSCIIGLAYSSSEDCQAIYIFSNYFVFCIYVVHRNVHHPTQLLLIFRLPKSQTLHFYDIDFTLEHSFIIEYIYVTGMKFRLRKRRQGLDVAMVNGHSSGDGGRCTDKLLQLLCTCAVVFPP